MIDKSRIKSIHEDLDKAIDGVLKSHGMKRNPSRIRYDDTSFKMTIEAAEVGEKTFKEKVAALRNGYDQDGNLLVVGDKVVLGGPSCRAESFGRKGTIVRNKRVAAVVEMDGKNYSVPFSILWRADKAPNLKAMHPAAGSPTAG